MPTTEYKQGDFVQAGFCFEKTVHLSVTPIVHESRKFKMHFYYWRS